MIYRPVEQERLWDSWLFEWQSTAHLFYLASQNGQGRIGHCTSTDLVHWERCEDIVLSHWPLTGMVIRQKGRFLMPLGEVVDNVQTTTFYVSDDLFRWRRLPPDEYRLRPEPPHYATEPDPWRPTVWWRDPFVLHHEEDGQYHAVVCAARPTFDRNDTGAVLAHLRTTDFREWEHLPPLEGPTGLFYHNEVPDLFTHDGRWYVLFSTGSVFGLRINTPSRRETTGTYYMVADRLEGPYRLPDECLLVGAGHGRMGPYVGRAFEFNGERLLYHQVRDDCADARWDATWGAPKRLCAGPAGELTARYWPGLEALETGELEMRTDDPPAGWEKVSNGWRGAAEAVGISCPVVKDAADFHVRVDVTGTRGGRCGLVLRAGGRTGVLVSLDFDTGQAEIGTARHHPIAGWGDCPIGFVPDGEPRDERGVIDTCRLPIETGRTYALRCLARAEHFEAYLDDRWLFTTPIPGAPLSGDILLYTERGRASFTDLRTAALSPLKRTTTIGEHHPQE
mgnify:FL=1